MDMTVKEYTWEEIRKHKLKSDRWIVVDDNVYDVSRWCWKHPGGERIIGSYAGQDASEAWYAFHIDRKSVMKYMKPLCIGRVADSKKPLAIIEDFHQVRNAVEKMGLFQPSVTFYLWTMLHIVSLDIAGCLILWYFGTGWLPFLSAAICLTIAQAQAGWSQHDYGHLSVCNRSRWNHWIHLFLINFMKGASASWWNYRHFNHHAKPNIIRKDPDIRLEYILAVGKVLPVELGQARTKYLPYNHQHWYFHLIMPPFLLPLYFNFEIPYFLITRKKWIDLFWMFMFFVRWQLMFCRMLGFFGVFGLFMFVRFIESHWFVWATQMSHLPMDIIHEEDEDWVTMQLRATCNVKSSWFNDWWSGHLNFQIEHHLFPTMPRHNLVKASPLVKSLCAKHGLTYHCKPLTTAFGDIIRSLKNSGEMWYEAYNM